RPRCSGDAIALERQAGIAGGQRADMVRRGFEPPKTPVLPRAVTLDPSRAGLEMHAPQAERDAAADALHHRLLVAPGLAQGARRGRRPVDASARPARARADVPASGLARAPAAGARSASAAARAPLPSAGRPASGSWPTRGSK